MNSKLSLKKLLASFKKINIAVVGDMMLDEYLIGSVARISPEAPVPVVNITGGRFVLGGAANVINNLAALGAKTSAYGLIGDDDNGKTFLRELSKVKDCINGLITETTRPTIIKSRVIAQGQQLLRLDRENDSPLPDNIGKKIVSEFKKNIKKTDGVILSDYNKGVLSESVTRNIVELCRNENKIVIADPKPHNFLNYTGASSITPNKKEVLDFLRLPRFKDENDLVEKMSNIKEELDLECLLLTRSEEGVSLFGEKHERVATLAREVYDVTGAGDTLISAFTLAKTAGASWLEAAKIGNTAAGIVVGKLGTASASSEEILSFTNNI